MGEEIGREKREGKTKGKKEGKTEGKTGAGFAAVIVSAALFGLQPLFARLVYANGGNALSVVFYRFALALIPAFLFLKIRGISLRLSLPDGLRILLLSVCGYGGTALLLFASYNFIPTGMATTVHFTYPVFVILASILFLREKAEPLKLVCVALCMGGIFLFYQGNAEGSPMGILLAFLSGITYTFYILYLAGSGIASMPMMKLIFYMNLCSAVILLIAGGAAGQLTVHLTGAGWIYMAFLSIAICLSAVWLFQMGVGKVGPQNAAILSTFEPLTSLAVGALFFQEAFTLRTLAGSGLILISVILAAKMKRTESENPKADPNSTLKRSDAEWEEPEESAVKPECANVRWKIESKRPNAHWESPNPEPEDLDAGSECLKDEWNPPKNPVEASKKG